MSDSESTFKNANAWRSKFRSRAHDAAHDLEDNAPHAASDHPLVCRDKAIIIDTDADLASLITRLRAAGSFAYDSEFIGELSYVPRLCLLQIATDQEIALVDPIADVDLMPLWELLADPSVQKLVHAGAQDMEPVVRFTGRPAANVMDTQIAAAFASLPYPISLQRIILQMLQVRLGKGLTFSHWDQRPLSAQQLRYAADDVRYLPAAWSELAKLLTKTGTMNWVRQECDNMCRTTPYHFDPETSFLKVRGSGSLDPRQLGILKELAIWRDGCAREADLPPRTVVKDEILIDICRRSPQTDEKLQNIQGLPRPARTEHAETILNAVKTGLANPVTEGLEARKTDELPREQFRNDALFSLTQSLCMARGIDPQIVTTRADVAELLRALDQKQPTDALRLMTSWRREVVGDWLVATYTAGQATTFTYAAGSVSAHP